MRTAVALDIAGFHTEADEVTKVMERVAVFSAPDLGPFSKYTTDQSLRVHTTDEERFRNPDNAYTYTGRGTMGPGDMFDKAQPIRLDSPQGQRGMDVWNKNLYQLTLREKSGTFQKLLALENARKGLADQLMNAQKSGNLAQVEKLKPAYQAILNNQKIFTVQIMDDVL